MTAGDPRVCDDYLRICYSTKMPSETSDVHNAIYGLVIYLKAVHLSIKEHYSKLRTALVDRIDRDDAKKLLQKVKTKAGFKSLEEQVFIQYAM